MTASSPSPISTLNSPSSPCPSQSTKLTPLQKALVSCSKPWNAASEALMKTISPCSSANPRPASSLMADNALYWYNIDGNLLVLGFPATLDLNGSFGRLGPYFNLPAGDHIYFNTTQPLTPTHIKKAKAQFELRPLTEDVDYPLEATECSRWAIDILQYLKIELENLRNNNVPSHKQPKIIDFLREPQDEDRFVFLVTSSPLFNNVPDPNKVTMPTMSRDTIGKSMRLSSPSKLREAAAAATKRSNELTANANTEDPHIQRFNHMPDPLGIYATLSTQYDFSGTSIVSPTVLDENEALIHPTEYGDKLVDGSLVFVEVYLKLWVIPATPNRPTNQLNGSRIYQLMLKRLQVLPCAEFSKDPQDHINDVVPIISSESSTSKLVDKRKRPLTDVDAADQPPVAKTTKASTRSARKDKKSAVAKEKQAESSSNLDDDFQML